jgi:cytochrome c heme-lyase
MSTSWLQQFCPVKSGKNVDAKGVCPIPKMTQKVNSTETIDSSSNESGCPIKTHCDSKTASAKPEDCGSGDGCPVKSTTKVIPEGCPVKSTSSEGCPVKSNTKDIPDGCPVKSTTKTIPEGCPVKNDNPLHNQHEGCPVKHNGEELKYNAIANDIEYNQKPSVGQKSPLSVAREESNIPKGSFTPSHQPVNAEKWVYPSQQQYFNAMKRKGYDPKENEIPAVLAIHNTVNEQGWSKIVEWERMRGNEAPKLKSFCGRPKDFSPRARWNMMW